VRSFAAALVVGAAVAGIWSAPLAGQSGTPGVAAANLPGTDAVKAFIASRIAKGFTPPKTPWGHPDISGVFTTKDEANTPFERPDEWAGRKMDDITPKEFAEAVAKRQQQAIEQAPFAGGGEPELGVSIAVPIHWFDNLTSKNSRPWFVVDPAEGKIPPLTAEAKNRVPAIGPGAPRPDVDRETALRGGRRDTYLDRYLGDRCIMWFSGVPHTPTLYGNSFQILQTQDYVVVRFEMIHEARMIRLYGRPHVGSPVYSYLGDSRGWWDGNTLVVETTNLHPTAPHRGTPGRNLRLIERFTRISPKQVEWTMTFDDPTTWERPWTYSMPMTEDNSQMIFEYACHEGNYGMANLLSGARAAENAPGR
jgi:hypothetical protein